MSSFQLCNVTLKGWTKLICDDLHQMDRCEHSTVFCSDKKLDHRACIIPVQLWRTVSKWQNNTHRRGILACTMAGHTDIHIHMIQNTGNMKK